MSVILEITREAIDFCLKVCQCAKTVLVTHIKPNLLISYFAADDKLQSGDLWDELLLKSQAQEKKTPKKQLPLCKCRRSHVFVPLFSRLTLSHLIAHDGQTLRVSWVASLAFF